MLELVTVFVFGAMIGSFLNVCIYRIPAGESVVFPRSHCVKCGKVIAWYDNIPVLSYLILRGRCRHCGAGFSMRYMMVELLVGVLFLLLWRELGVWEAVVGMIFFGVMVVASFIDLDHMMIPDRFTVGGLLLSVILSMLYPALHGVNEGLMVVGAVKGALHAGIGVIIGSGVLLWIALLGEYMFSKEAMGFGDIKFMGLIGGICGWKGALFSIFGGATMGACILVPILLIQKMRGKAEGTAVPFGPWLSLGAVVYYLWMREEVDGYFAMLKIVFMG